MINRTLLVLVFVAIFACKSSIDSEVKSINSFDDPVLVQIENLQDRRDVESLMAYFQNENAVYRAAAVEAFASIQDTASIETLSKLLDDKSSKVRKLCAYALGQTYNEGTLVKLKARLSIEDSVAVKKVIWEAMGKCLTSKTLNYFTTVLIEDPMELEGYAWGIYRAGIKGVTNDTLVEKAINLLYPNNTFETRFAASNYLARARNINIDNIVDSIISSAILDKSPFVRMAATSALGKSKSDKTMAAIKNTIVKDSDYRVRINALRTMNSFDFVETQEAVFNALQDENVNVAITAASVLFNKANSAVSNRIIGLADSVNWRVSAQLLGAALKMKAQDPALLEKIKSKFSNSTNDYEKAELLTSLGNSFSAYDFIVTQTFATESLVVGTAGISALSNIRAKEDFPEELDAPLADVFKQAILTGDLAMIGIATSVISTPEYEYKNLYDTIDFLFKAKDGLSLPKDNEGYQALQAAIDFFEDTTDPTPVKNEYNHPIDWDLVKVLPHDKKMKIITSKGEIKIELFVDLSPGSVANFVQLAQSGYYNDKNFHRVVPNFVAQGGCNRGDGWGGESYSIRSEFGPLKYGEGYIGMASAGKDTEGTQWFITHSPTPHLDGKYTIFARVNKGMDIVHTLEIGDKIISVQDL